MKILVKSVKKTANANKLFLAIYSFYGCSMSLLVVMTGRAILHSPPKKEP